jgi:hypothetical protein
VRTDPTDNGGLFLGRRPGTAPIRYRALPKRGSAARRRLDATLAFGVLVVMTIVGASFWGPIPAAWLWVASMLDYWTGSVFLGISVGFAGMLLTLLAGLAVMRALDHVWILIRRAAGHDQRKGVMSTIFAVSAVIGVSGFTFWLLVIAGPGSSLAPSS